ncbi:LacI family transcriptional regulator [Propionicimonas paludicola]|uniref:LacI family transcriptional regulator n=1 Tax=Propionicimonas paludicola TaxID=185243 RepID=A0A2A9CW28_9ACTN|nr:LacI family DNA-binding transcriptional regulator [Propionicimonas paludicola]PFG18341.1 LacI family transcriptional regulator [Propionicimonas paludicola]
MSKAKAGKRATLASLGDQLGLSRQTISNVLNNPSIVSEETRNRVLEAIEASGYRPSAAARALRTKRSMTIALRLYPAGDGIEGALMDRFTHAVTEAAQAHGYRIALFCADDMRSEADALVELHEEAQIDAAIISDTYPGDPRPAALWEAGLPFSAFGRQWERPEAPHSWVDVDGRVGVRAAVEHLVAAGYRRIGYLGPRVGGASEDRRAGCLEALAECVPSVGGDQELTERDTPKAGAAAASALQERGVTAVVCGSDAMAMGALSVFGHRDGHAPIVGFDDTPVARAMGLSSVAQPVEEAARLAVELALAAANGEPSRQLLIEPELVVRRLEAFAR